MTILHANLNNTRVVSTYLLVIHAVQLLLIATALMTLNRARILVHYDIMTVKFTVNLTYSRAQRKKRKKTKT